MMWKQSIVPHVRGKPLIRGKPVSRGDPMMLVSIGIARPRIRGDDHNRRGGGLY